MEQKRPGYPTFARRSRARHAALARPPHERGPGAVRSLYGAGLAAAGGWLRRGRSRPTRRYVSGVGVSAVVLRGPTNYALRMRVSGACLVVSLLTASGAVAQPLGASPAAEDAGPQATDAAGSHAHATTTIVLVMEAPGGVRAAAGLRKALHDAGFTVLSLGEARRKSIVPDALLAVATDRMQTVQVVYWGRDGGSDTLSAVSPATADQLQAVVVALSSALIERHRNEASPIGREVLARTRLFEDPRASRAIYAMLGQAGRLWPRTHVLLRYEDF